MKNKGFTIIELLMVIAIIGILASIILAATLQAREKGKIGKAREEIHSIRIAAELLVSDTGKYPGGCPPKLFIGMRDGEVVTVANSTSGFLTQPSVGSGFGPYCSWNAANVAAWRGSYLAYSPTQFLDPWGTSYRLDYDYFGKSGRVKDGLGPGCGSSPYNGSDGVAFVSHGPDKIPYTCDDIVQYLTRCQYTGSGPYFGYVCQ